MFSLLRQSVALSIANLRSVRRRLWISLSMIMSISLVVVVLLGFLSMSNGFRQTFERTGANDIALVMKRGAVSEVSSLIGTRQAHLIEEAPGVVRSAEGISVVSRELVVPVDAIRGDTGKLATLSLRGIGSTGLSLRPVVQLSEGRMFRPGTAEIVVGARLADRYKSMRVGDKIAFGRTEWKVVGLFTAGGGVFESEILADAGIVQTLFDRQNIVQSVRVKLQTPDAFQAFRTYVEDTLDMGLKASTEKSYFAAQASDVSDIILWLGWPLAITMAVGAAIGALTTMYSSVSDRLVEIATVRAIGFSRAAAFVGTLVEAMALTVCGLVIGIIFTWIGLDGLSASTRGGANTQLTFQLVLSWPLAVNASALALCIGLLGGGLPAFRATRVPLRRAMTGRS